MIEGKKLVYLAGPYSHEDPKVLTKRFKLYSKLAAYLISKKDVYIFSPITHSHPMITTKAFDRENFWKYSFWMPFDKAILDICDELWIVDTEGWKESKGLKEEVIHAELASKPIKMVTKRGKVSKFTYEN
jgi:hypothetical protein